MTASQDAVERLIAENQALVRSIASTIARRLPPNVDTEDLIAYGQVGLAGAARDFDPGRGTSFATFAYYRIRGAIYDGISRLSWTSTERDDRIHGGQLAS